MPSSTASSTSLNLRPAITADDAACWDGTPVLHPGDVVSAHHACREPSAARGEE